VRISVVIPTTGRASLAAAVDSVLGQTLQAAEVLIVYDGIGELAVPRGGPAAPPITVMRTGGNHGGGAARNLGVGAASGDLVALLDDDDRWQPEKLRLQLECYLAHVGTTSPPLIVACRQAEVTTAGRVCAVTPRRLIGVGQPLADYLFAKRAIRPGEAGISSSMLLTTRDLLSTVQFDETLPRHQDWDWLLRAEADAGAVVRMCPETLVAYTRHQPGHSVSSSGSWQTSLDWVVSNRNGLTARQQANVILTVTAPLAARNREWGAVMRLCRRALRLGAAPRGWPFVIIDSGLTAWRGRRARRPG
jgi:glycosyltransferase involved in cell wall biosynthesis